MNVLFEVFINLYQGFLMIFFMHLRLPSRREVRWWEDILFIGLVGGFLSLYLFPWMTVADSVGFLIPLIYAIVTQRGSWAQRLLWWAALSLTFSAIASTSLSFYTYAFGVSFDDLMQYSALRIGLVLSTNIVLTIVLLPLARIGRGAEGFSGGPSLAALVLTLLLELATMELLYYYQIQSERASRLLLCADICIFGLLILTLLLYEILTQSARKQHLAELRLQTLSLDQAHQQEMTAFYNEMLAVQHDLKKQLDTVRQVLAASSDAEAVRELLRIEKPLSIQYITGSTAVDAILTSKRALMEQHQIAFTFQPYPLQVLPIDSASFCILLSNMLDNAIEAVLRVKAPSAPRRISLQFARSWSMFYITCVNTMEPDTIKRYGDRFISSKDNKRIHGFGVESIRQVVEEGGGTCGFTISGSEFKVDIVLPDNQ